MDCIFCEIAKGTIPSSKVYEDDLIIAFNDIVPVAPIHVVITPKEHVLEKVNQVNKDTINIVTYIFEKIPEIAKTLGIEDFRVVTNNGPLSGQSVSHVHFHLIGGKEDRKSVV